MNRPEGLWLDVLVTTSCHVTSLLLFLLVCKDSMQPSSVLQFNASNCSQRQHCLHKSWGVYISRQPLMIIYFV